MHVDARGRRLVALARVREPCVVGRGALVALVVVRAARRQVAQDLEGFDHRKVAFARLIKLGSTLSRLLVRVQLKRERLECGANLILGCKLGDVEPRVVVLVPVKRPELCVAQFDRIWSVARVTLSSLFLTSPRLLSLLGKCGQKLLLNLRRDGRRAAGRSRWRCVEAHASALLLAGKRSVVELHCVLR
eukprot:scaffold297485_cov27-Tisochrysis_lutea.AAC.1